MISFFATYFLLIIISSYFCNGWYMITRGALYENPDGTTKFEGMLLGHWQIFWEKVIDTEVMYYTEKNTFKKYLELQYQDKMLSDKFICEGKTTYFFLCAESISDKEHLRLEALSSCKFLVSGNMYTPYLENKKYRFPSWIRKPVSSCLNCYPSVYGTLIWLTFSTEEKNAFASFNNKLVADFIFWLIFIVSISYLNTIFYNKTRK